MITPHLQQALKMLAGRIVNTLFDGLLLALAAAIVLRISGRQNARTRFAVWFVTLLGIAALPFLTLQNSLQRAVATHVTLPSSWAVVLIALWGTGAAFLTARLGHGLWRIHKLRASCEEVEIPAELLAQLNAARGTRIYVSDDVDVPAAIGFFRPAIILPRSLASGLSSEELEVVLLHELAHVERWDDWSNLAQQVVKAFFFFNPAVLWIERRLSLEREMACDDIVVERTGGAKTYASCLISFAEKMQQMRALALVQPLVNRMCQLSRRIAEIMDEDRPARNFVRKPLVLVSAGLVAASIAALPHLPRMVSFGESASPSAIARVAAFDTGIQPIAKMTPAKYTLPTESGITIAPKTRAKQATLKKTLARPAARRLLAVKPQTVAMEQRIIAPTLVIFESRSDLESGTQVWRLCIWQFAPDGAEVPLAPTIVLKI